jgi:hypothetical protein
MASKYLKKFQVPNDFENILSDFAKEILRNQPKDIIDFGIEYFKGLENNIKLDYKDKGENRPENYHRPENQEPNIINAPNNLEISREDKNRLQRSMDKIERINKEPEFIPEREKEKEEEQIEEKREEKREEKEEYYEEKKREENTENIQRYEQNEQYMENNVKVTKQITVTTKETIIRNGQIIKDEEKVVQKNYEDNDDLNRFKEIEQKKDSGESPILINKVEENQQQGRYTDIDNQQEEKGKDGYGNWFLKHSMNKETDKKTKVEQPKEEPEPEIPRNEMGYQTWFNNNSEGSMVISKSNDIKQQDEKISPQNIEQSEPKQEGKHDNYDDWFSRHSGNGLIISRKTDPIKIELNFERYQGDYETWFGNHCQSAIK